MIVYFFVKGNNLLSMQIKNDTDFASGQPSVTNYADEITGLIPFRDQLILFTRQAIYKIAGTSGNFKSTEITTQIGCIEPDTISEVGGDILWYRMELDLLRLQTELVTLV